MFFSLGFLELLVASARKKKRHLNFKRFAASLVVQDLSDYFILFSTLHPLHLVVMCVRYIKNTNARSDGSSDGKANAESDGEPDYATRIHNLPHGGRSPGRAH